MKGSYDEDIFLVMLGPQHIEMALIRLLGDWLVDSGWSSTLVQANITTTGRADSMLKGSHVTRTRYAHQVQLLHTIDQFIYIKMAVASHHHLQLEEYESYCEQLLTNEDRMEFHQWYEC